jgi:hypothetical protein
MYFALTLWLLVSTACIVLALLTPEHWLPEMTEVDGQLRAAPAPKAAS